jgi:3-dehydroquinate dehydratase-2
MKILIINGPNLNLLGLRDKSIYGELSLDEINSELIKEFPQIEFHFFQANDEGSIIDKIQNSQDFDGLIINPGGYSHTSVAIKDALDLIKIPKIEVHLSNLSKRESFRQNLITASSCDGYISGIRHYGYFAAVYSILKLNGIKTDLN